MENIAAEIGARIKKGRIGLGLSQKELADSVGVKATSIAMYENGARTPSIEVFLNLTKTLGISPNYLLGATDQRDVIANEERGEAFRQFASLSLRDKRVIIEVMRALASVKE